MAAQVTRRVELPTGALEIAVEESLFDIDALIGFAARANAKRGFLFLSKVLGKHWPVSPRDMQEVQTALAESIPVDLPGPVVFIAMAETAIGLGQGVFEACLRAWPRRQAMFIHTSRYSVPGMSLIEFEESHSHAPRQFLHMPNDPELREMLCTAKSLVLLDDEVSTGNTFLNLSKACRTLNPSIRHVHLSTITNFMGKDATADLSARFGLPVTMGAVLSGRYTFATDHISPADPCQFFEVDAERGASAMFGRVGIVKPLAVPADLVDRLLEQISPGESVLVLGTGELMHPAFVLGRALEIRGVDVMVQSTTRSPILTWGAVRHARTFPDSYGEGIANYLYNVFSGQYDHVFICHETLPGGALQKLASSLGGRLFHFKSDSAIEEVPVR